MDDDDDDDDEEEEEEDDSQDMSVRIQNSLLQYDFTDWSCACRTSSPVWPATKADTMCWSSLHLVIDVGGSTPFSCPSAIYIHRTSCLLIKSLIRVTIKEPEISAYWHNANAFSTHQLPSTIINLHLPGCGNKIDANLFLSLAVAQVHQEKWRWKEEARKPTSVGLQWKNAFLVVASKPPKQFPADTNRMKKGMARGVTSDCKVNAKSVKANIYHGK